MVLNLLTESQISNHLQKISNWILKDKVIFKSFKFDNYPLCIKFVNQIAIISEEINHHPEIIINWGKVELKIYTHDLNGLTEKDFILAGKIDKLETSII
jgi:4a-hydroxytetrahydrobiopterin dehydratase